MDCIIVSVFTRLPVINKFNSEGATIYFHYWHVELLKLIFNKKDVLQINAKVNKINKSKVIKLIAKLKIQCIFKWL
jgi:hypothetical protein